MATASWAADVRTVVDGLWFAEGPRWHDGALWCSDIHGHRVLRIDVCDLDHPNVHTIVEVADDNPSGIGWLPDNRLLFVGMRGKVVYRLETDGTIAVHVDLASVARGVINDMIVADNGSAYVGDMGLDPDDLTAGISPGQLFKVDPDGGTMVVADDLGAPNGPALSDDGRTLLIAESSAFRLSAFKVEADGSLSARHEFAAVPPAPDGPGFAPPDGICLDAEGAAWVADPIGGRVLRLLPGGVLTHTVNFAGEAPVACVLCGSKRQTLFVCVAPQHEREAVLLAPRGRIDAVHVTVAGVGRP
jgi:sugar lactone lactonase YvrE